jgi:hypothetical protein
MLKWLIKKRLTAFEKKFGYDASYVRELLEADTRAVFLFAKASALGEYRKDIPRDVFWATRLVGIVSEDCGPCSQLTVTMALADRAEPKVLAAVLRGDDAALPEDVRLGVRFARATLARSLEADELREAIIQRWGRRALVSIAFGLTAARIYPTVKYALGYGRSCQRVVVAGERIAVVRDPQEAAA